MLISVVVCTYNPADDVLARALDAILSQDLDPATWELLVVDNNSNLPVSGRPYIADGDIRVVSEPEQGLSKARECGLTNTRGSILVFVDDDNMLAPDYLSKVSRIFADPTIGVVSGAILPEYDEQPPAWLATFENMLAIRRLPTEGTYLTDRPPYNEHFAIGAGMAVRRDVIEGYYRSIAEGSAYVSGRVGTQLSSSEDIDLDFFAISNGYRVGTVGSLKLRHVIPADRTTVDYISRLAVASVRSAAEVNAKWSAIFGGDVIELFSTPKRQLRIKCALTALLRHSPKFAIRYHFLKTTLEELDRRRR
ncbi:glycosyltransferase [Mycobacterium sp. RTGN5]|uniref:glycosyltransferase n=1 Tax=Mycobacterium sp. RTGN5 TaxID=3016522 RepID=UPI0029C7064F|nr:glycosyltransferase [Mycobacterium sp. RTGN5]